LDQVVVGDVASEATHVYQGEKTEAGVISGRPWRQARRGGFFSYELHARLTRPQTLLCVVGSHDRVRKYELLVNGTPVALPAATPEASSPYALYRIPLPADLKPDPIKVTFKARPDWDAGSPNVFALALLADAPGPSAK
jgi:hypothetical protein